MSELINVIYLDNVLDFFVPNAGKNSNHEIVRSWFDDKQQLEIKDLCFEIF